MAQKHEDYSLSGLYYRYKKTTDDDIRKYLDKIKIVVLENKGEGTIHGYYELSETEMKKIKERPRNTSLTFDAIKTSDKLVTGLVKYKTIVFLVKSSSRFFLKPDIGEVFDAINFHDLYGDLIKAIVINEGHETLDGTDGEHFLMTATLLVDKNTALRKNIDLDQDPEK